MMTKETQKEAYALARAIVSDHLSVQDIEWLVSENSTSDPRRDTILEACYPGYKKVQQKIEKVIDTDLNELRWEEINAYSYTAFYIGFASAMYLATGDAKQGVNHDR